jgi:hypothetical protein
MNPGARSTDDLSPDQRPRSLKMTRRAQPYRRKRGRQMGPSLSAQLKGAPFFLPNPMDTKRRFQKRHGR